MTKYLIFRTFVYTDQSVHTVIYVFFFSNKIFIIIGFSNIGSLKMQKFESFESVGLFYIKLKMKKNPYRYVET